MNRVDALGGVAGLLLLGCGLTFGQTVSPVKPGAIRGIPAGTTLPGVNTAARTTSRAQVIYRRGELEIVAANSDLNQILRDVALQTGMRISGGVADAPVYGTYGPAAAAEVLSSLLQGTGSNMLLTVDGTGAPTSLVLTSRTGAPADAPVATASVALPATPPAGAAPARAESSPVADSPQPREAIPASSAVVAGQAATSSGAAAQPSQNSTIPDVLHRWPYQQQMPPQMPPH